MLCARAPACRFRPIKPGCPSIQDDLRGKLARFDFALNDADNNGCRPIELPNGWPVQFYTHAACQPALELHQRLCAYSGGSPS